MNNDWRTRIENKQLSSDKLIENIEREKIQGKGKEKQEREQEKENSGQRTRKKQGQRMQV